jgi:hypothetical protein
LWAQKLAALKVDETVAKWATKMVAKKAEKRAE